MANRINVITPSQPNLELFFDLTGSLANSSYDQLEVILGGTTYLGNLTVLPNTGTRVVLRGVVDLSSATGGFYQPNTSPMLEVNLKKKPVAGPTPTPVVGENVQPVLVLPPHSIAQTLTSKKSTASNKKRLQAVKAKGITGKAAARKSQQAKQPKVATSQGTSKPTKSAAKKAAPRSTKANPKSTAKGSVGKKTASSKTVAKKSTPRGSSRAASGKSTPKSAAKSARGKRKG